MINVEKKETFRYKIIINNLCCEYCLKGMIEELLNYDGIVSASSNFEYNDKQNIEIYITYDKNLITIEKIKKIEYKYNNWFIIFFYYIIYFIIILWYYK